MHTRWTVLLLLNCPALSCNYSPNKMKYHHELDVVAEIFGSNDQGK